MVDLSHQVACCSFHGGRFVRLHGLSSRNLLWSHCSLNFSKVCSFSALFLHSLQSSLNNPVFPIISYPLRTSCESWIVSQCKLLAGDELFIKGGGPVGIHAFFIGSEI